MTTHSIKRFLLSNIDLDKIYMGRQFMMFLAPEMYHFKWSGIQIIITHNDVDDNISYTVKQSCKFL